MFLKHAYFYIDLDAKKVFDINSKEVRITGNAYRILTFLCEKKSGTITDIGTSLDWAKDYDENNLRQYRYKIETLIGYKVIEYKNGIYSLVGGVKKVDELARDERNTVLLRADGVNSSQKLSTWLSKNVKIAVVSFFGLATISFLAIVYWPSYVKKSADGICHERGSTYYSRTKNFTRFASLEECLKSGGRSPKK